VIAVLRLGHRPLRDKRITTHVCLVARAFGADKVILTARDDALVRTVRGVVKRFGGSFELEVQERPHRSIVQEWRKRGARVAHLTMYGEPYGEVLPRLRGAADLLLVVGAEKVPGDLYQLADVNVAVGNQPHSEVAALAILLHALEPRALARPLDGELRIRPSARGKRVEPATGRSAGGARPAGPEEPATGRSAGGARPAGPVEPATGRSAGGARPAGPVEPATGRSAGGARPAGPAAAEAAKPGQGEGTGR
jgi:tRNA (cytidine56-2'-O)-methyltransferase